MTRYLFAGASCFFLLSVVPVAAQTISTVSAARRVVPGPEADVGLLSLAMVAAATALIYWRKRKA